MSLTLLYIVITRSVSDVAISERDSFASLGMTHGRLFVGHYTSKLDGWQAPNGKSF
jgi:hypothetical protein